MAAAVRAALYLRVSTGRQADSDLSIPDQRRQAKGYCASRGWEIVADYVEPGASATDDRRPEFQRMIDAATVKPPAFDVILVHSFSPPFRCVGVRLAPNANSDHRSGLLAMQPVL
jgi:DNA invertase Pin-like site-specific DNA recombinase